MDVEIFVVTNSPLEKGYDGERFVLNIKEGQCRQKDRLQPLKLLLIIKESHMATIRNSLLYIFKLWCE